MTAQPAELPPIELPPIEAVFFDFGGVFIASPFAAVHEAAARHGIGGDELIDLVFGPYDHDTDHPWHQLERGETTFDAARSAITALSEERGLGSLDPIAVLSELSTGYDVREFMVQAVRDLRARGIKTAIITNNIAEFGSMWRAMIPIDELFDDIVDSSSVGVRKPDPAIFELACERVEVAPTSAAFIDDYLGNVTGANAVGLRGVWCGYSVDTTRKALAELLAIIG